jgi:hypothetical protein
MSVVCRGSISIYASHLTVRLECPGWPCNLRTPQNSPAKCPSTRATRCQHVAIPKLRFTCVNVAWSLSGHSQLSKGIMTVIHQAAHSATSATHRPKEEDASDGRACIRAYYSGAVVSTIMPLRRLDRLLCARKRLVARMRKTERKELSIISYLSALAVFVLEQKAREVHKA